MKVEYKASVLTPAGFRGVDMVAEVKSISAKRVEVVEVLTIDGEDVEANMSRTGAKRQSFYGVGAAARQVGAIKNLSACRLIVE